MTKKKIYKPAPVSGFPEWLPEVRRLEQQWMDHIRRVFEAYGYCPIETPAVETLEAITAKGGDGGADVDKEIYVLERLHADPEEKKEARLALHFDQTVPLARYVAQHFNDLTFPFKRYQMQKVWRGERPQAGRFREFYQCDIDVINVDHLPLHFDAEMPAIIWEILSTLPGMEKEKIQLRVSNRKILKGLVEADGLDTTQAFRVIDKKDKLEESQFDDLLMEAFRFSNPTTDKSEIIKRYNALKEFLLAAESYLGKSVEEQIQILNQNIEKTNLPTETIEGFKELKFILQHLKHLPENAAVADLSIVRGLDYYTGTVYETVFTDDPSYGSICSGGRYDDLAGNYINKNLPGVGISIGFSRLFTRLLDQGKLPVRGVSPAHVLVLLGEEGHRAAATAKAAELRAQGFNVEQYHAPQKIGKQFAYAEKKGIPFACVPMDEKAATWEIKNLHSREQKPEEEGLIELERFKNHA